MLASKYHCKDHFWPLDLIVQIMRSIYISSYLRIVSNRVNFDLFQESVQFLMLDLLLLQKLWVLWKQNKTIQNKNKKPTTNKQKLVNHLLPNILISDGVLN